MNILFIIISVLIGGWISVGLIQCACDLDLGILPKSSNLKTAVAVFFYGPAAWVLYPIFRLVYWILQKANITVAMTKFRRWINS